MIENILYVIVGFTATYISLEIAWHFAACRIKGNDKIKSCMFKEVRTALIATHTPGGRAY
jgi:hypothetical protein